MLLEKYHVCPWNRACRQRIDKGNEKAIPLEAWTGPEGSRRLRLSHLKKSTHEGGRLSALRIGRLYPQEIFLVLMSIRG